MTRRFSRREVVSAGGVILVGSAAANAARKADLHSAPKFDVIAAVE